MICMPGEPLFPVLAVRPSCASTSAESPESDTAIFVETPKEGFEPAEAVPAAGCGFLLRWEAADVGSDSFTKSTVEMEVGFCKLR